MTQWPMYEATDCSVWPAREYLRPANVVGELPLEMRRETLDRIAAVIEKKVGMQFVFDKPRGCTSTLHYGEPAYRAFGLSAAQAKAHPMSDILVRMGTDLPLSLLG